ncbi:MAG: thiamine pyrophosphate-dependent dehydrogenase E1 component subunit alpha [Caldilineae bacterium]|nr:MAG: thiamine pyrophosphate-dependent dehydrogenase E1 component subunit alpha [Caldilineae bacterium]
MSLKKQDLLRMYKTMLLIRRFEEQAVQFSLQGELRGSLHPCIGQEATNVGAVFALRPDDLMTCTYRGHGHCIAKGLDPREGMAELLGRETGCSKGKGGSMHWTDPAIGLLGENAIVGAGAPIAVGAALSAKLDGSDRVAITFFGDGAINQGALLEALNLAAAWQAPVIFFCENNLYSEMTPIANMIGTETLAERAEGFGIPAMIVDGYDVIEVYEKTSEAVARARAGGGPTFIEAKTYRLFGHMVGDNEPYRTREEVEEWRARDPIKTFPERLQKEFKIAKKEIEAIREEVEAEIAEIARFALESPWPKVEEIETFVFA